MRYSAATVDTRLASSVGETFFLRAFLVVFKLHYFFSCSGVVLGQNIADYMSGDSPVMARRMDGGSNDLGDKKKSMFSRSKALGARSQVIKTYVTRQQSEAGDGNMCYTQ